VTRLSIHVDPEQVGPKLDEAFALLTDAELDRMIERAWYHAARSWSDYRNIRDMDRQVLLQAAQDDQEWWQRLVDEQKRRRA
jgi:hypothetical protein